MYDPARDAWNEKQPLNNKKDLMEKEPGSTPEPVFHSSDAESSFTNEQTAANMSLTSIDSQNNGSNHSKITKDSSGNGIDVIAEQNSSSDKSSVSDHPPTDNSARENNLEKKSTTEEQHSTNNNLKMAPIDISKMSRFIKRKRPESPIVDNKLIEDNKLIGANKPTENNKTIEKTDIIEENSEKQVFKKPKSRASKEIQESRAREQRELEEKRNNNDHVRSHYNARPNVSTTERKKSPIIRLKKFNNLIKSHLISTFVFSRALVLDIGVGKGGDLPKWQREHIEGLIGIDIADVSVQQAEERYSKMRSKPFWAQFFAADAFGSPIEEIIGYNSLPVDVVSCQFTMHYAFASEKRAERMLENVSRSLDRGGVFIGTIPNSDVIAERIRNLPPGEKKFGNSVYSVEFTNTPPTSFDPPFGYEYLYFLQDAVGNVPEYVVPFEAFQSLAEKHHLELVYKKPFMEMFTEALSNRNFRESCERMDVHDSEGNYGIDGDEREACAFYLAFAFKKT